MLITKKRIAWEVIMAVVAIVLCIIIYVYAPKKIEDYRTKLKSKEIDYQLVMSNVIQENFWGFYQFYSEKESASAERRMYDRDISDFLSDRRYIILSQEEKITALGKFYQQFTFPYLRKQGFSSEEDYKKYRELFIDKYSHHNDYNEFLIAEHEKRVLESNINSEINFRLLSIEAITDFVKNFQLYDYSFYSDTILSQYLISEYDSFSKNIDGIETSRSFFSDYSKYFWLVPLIIFFPLKYMFYIIIWAIRTVTH